MWPNLFKKENRWIWVFSLVVVALLGTAGIYFFRANNKDLAEGPRGEIAANEADPAVWGIYYPKHYDSYKRNFESAEKPSHFDTRPWLKPMYAGTGYVEAFNDPRGHVYSLDDIRAIHPARFKSGAVCNTCKSAQVPEMIARYGDAYYAKPFQEINSQLKHPIACLDCHDPKTMNLRISRPALIEAFQRQGKDVNKATRQEMRSLVCAQCHVTYYFEKDTKKLVFPWDNGFKSDQVLAYFDQRKFSEWNHPEAGSGLVKARHAEYEIFLGSTHHSAGVACADCHMPYVKEGNVKISSHYWTSPLKNTEQSCAVCHREGADWLKSRVRETQSRTEEMMAVAGEAVVRAINELKNARETPGVNQETLRQAQEMHRKGQWYLDWIAVTNGTGVHNPQESLRDLGKAIDYLNRSVILARDAAGK